MSQNMQVFFDGLETIMNSKRALENENEKKRKLHAINFSARNCQLVTGFHLVLSYSIWYVSYVHKLDTHTSLVPMFVCLSHMENSQMQMEQKN